MSERICSISGCDRRHYAKGWCKRHYSINWVHGDPLCRPPTAIERFRSKYEVAVTGCWIWTAGTRAGYGEFGMGKKKIRAHRWSYEHFRSPIPAGMVIDHLCRTPRCVNPAHMEPVTNTENILRGTAPTARHARKTECHRGHPFDERNTRVNQRGHRTCRACDREKVRKRRAANMERAA